MFELSKYFLGCLLLLVVAKAENEAPKLAPAIAPKAAEVPINPAAIETFQNCSNRWDTYCYDCRTIVICAGEEQPIFQGACPFSEPYCDMASPYSMVPRCVVNMYDKQTELSCDSGQMSTPQRCTGFGFYPDANDARKYYNCHGPGTTYPEIYTCPEDTMFDTISYNCKRIIPFDCTGKNNEFVLHATNPAYYAYCRTNGLNTEIVPYKCRDDQNFVYNLRTNTCEYQCKGEGQFVDRESCYHYYECYRTGNTFSYRRVECPPMHPYYSKEEGTCVYPHNYCEPEVGWE